MASAQWAEFPSREVGSHILRIQDKAESLYERGDYRRAHIIYSDELARLGDKYAQYMAGYMYLMGQGVMEDPVMASGWYRLAAERDAPEFAKVRDQLLRSFDAEQRRRSDALYIELRKEYSDLALIMRLLEQDLEEMEEGTSGSRVSGRGSSAVIVYPRSGMSVPADQHADRIIRSAQARLNFLVEELEIEPLELNMSHEELNGLRARVNEQLATIDDVPAVAPR